MYWMSATRVSVSRLESGNVAVAEAVNFGLMVVCFVLAGSIYAYVIGAICGIVSQMDPATQHYNQTMDQLNGFMEEIHLPQEQRNDYRDYFTFCKHKFKVEYYLNLLEQTINITIFRKTKTQKN